METTENKLNKNLGPAVGILALLVVVALAGLFFYKGMYNEHYSSFSTTKVENIPSYEEIPVPEDEQDLEVLESELESMTAEVDEQGLFGLEELDAELANLDELDAMLADEVTQ